MRAKIIKYVIMALVIIVGIVWYAVTAKDNDEGGLLFTTESIADEGEISSSEGGETEVSVDNVMEETKEETTTSMTYVVVYVCGEVQSPGVYELLEGERVISAIEAAGGFSETAAVDFLNLARIIVDGEKIDVPSLAEARQGIISTKDYENGASQGGSSADNNESDKTLININTATKEELMELPGIGESRAASIIAYREENGAFGSIEEIMLVSGIKEGAFAKIKAYIKV